MRARQFWLSVGLCATLAACAPATPPTLPTAPTATTIPATLTTPPATLPPPTRPSPEVTVHPPTETLPPPEVTATPLTLNPLTGLSLTDPSVLLRRPLAVKIAHFPRKVRAAQSGLALADNVWEHYAEGGTTRFTAIFLSNAPDHIGNVRSARLVDTYLGAAYEAILVASGSSQGTLERLRATDFYTRVIAEATGYKGCPILCREVAADVDSSKLFTSAPAVWALAEELQLGSPGPLAGYVFDAAPPANGQPLTTLHINFQLNNTVVEWRYEAATGLYARWIDTNNLPELTPHIDHYNEQPITAATIVLLTVPYTPSNIREEEAGQVFYSYDIPLVGSGPAWVFRNGQIYEVTWERNDNGLPRFTDAQGQPFPFHPGSTWFVPVDPDSPHTLDETQQSFTIRFKVPSPIPATP